MSNNRMWLEHIDTGERVLLAKFNSAWCVYTIDGLSTHDRLEAAFDKSEDDGRVYADGRRDGHTYYECTWRLVYEHDPENRMRELVFGPEREEDES